jgi:hypothetical protein
MFSRRWESEEHSFWSCGRPVFGNSPLRCQPRYLRLIIFKVSIKLVSTRIFGARGSLVVTCRVELALA